MTQYNEDDVNVMRYSGVRGQVAPCKKAVESSCELDVRVLVALPFSFFCIRKRLYLDLFVKMLHRAFVIEKIYVCIMCGLGEG